MSLTRRFSDASLRTKLTLVVLGVTSVVLGAALVFVTITQVRQLRRDLMREGTLVARVVAENSVADLAFDDAEVAAETLAGLAVAEHVAWAVLFDADGKAIASYGAVPAGDGGAPGGDGARFAGDTLRVTQAVADDHERYGTLLVVTSTAELEARVVTTVLTMGAALLLLLAAAYALARRLGRVVTGPILDLADVAGRVSRAHDYTLRAEKHGGDEVGQLTDTFNRMLEEIRGRELAREIADRRTREMGAFLANMSHELRTPLNAILGFSELLLTRTGDKLDARERRFLTHIHGGGEHLLRLINDILDLSKVEAGRMALAVDRFSAAHLAEGIIATMLPVARQNEVELVLHADAAAPELAADELKVKQILFNLVANAVKFSPRGGRVEIDVRHMRAAESRLGQPAMRFTVVDHGPGIAAADHARIFEPFAQADTAALAGLEGTGLGLTLVKRFAELHGGLVGLESALGAGASFWVELPQRHAGVSVSIVVVEPDLARYGAVKALLEKAGCTTVMARDVAEAEQLVRDGAPTAIALDVSKSADAWQTLGRLGEERDGGQPPLPILLLSTAPDDTAGPAVLAADVLPGLIDRPRSLERLRALMPAAAQGPAPRHVLVIDDQPAVVDLVAAWLGPDVPLVHAASGAAGLQRAAEWPPALILLDLNMEPMDGFEIAMELESDPRTADVPVVIFTARELDEHDLARLRGKVDALVHKRPEARAELTAVVGALLRSRAPSASSTASPRRASSSEQPEVSR